jgi:hypothetical protein
VSWLIAYSVAAIVLWQAHLASPILAAWSNGNMRRQMYAEWEWFILLPLGCLSVAVIIGLSSSTTRDPAFSCLAVVFLWWDAWHFGSQHFGVAALLGWRSMPRWVRQVVTIGPTMIILLLSVYWRDLWDFGTRHFGPAATVWMPSHSPLVLIVLVQVINLIHWLTDIGLSTWKARRWMLFLSIVLILGLSGFLWKGISIDPRYCGHRPVCEPLYAFPVLLSVTIGIGFVHFLYSRWRYQGRYMRVMGQAL